MGGASCGEGSVCGSMPEAAHASPQYGNPGFWEARYRQDPSKTAFDWYLTYNGLQEVLVPHLRECDLVLVVGCGVSRMPAQLYDDGFRNVTSIDISPTVIRMMQEEHKERKGLEWHHMDVRMLDFPSSSSMLLLTKASWMPYSQGREASTMYSMPPRKFGVCCGPEGSTFACPMAHQTKDFTIYSARTWVGLWSTRLLPKSIGCSIRPATIRMLSCLYLYEAFA